MKSSKKLGTTELLFSCAQKMSLNPMWLIANNTFVFTVQKEEYYINLARSPLNSEASAAYAKNKYLTRIILDRHHIQNIPYFMTSNLKEAVTFLATYGKIVAKPVKGAGARDIHIISKVSEFDNLNISNYILEKYIEGIELRYLLLNNEIIAVHRSEYGNSVASDRPLKRISLEKAQWEKHLSDTAKSVSQVLQLHFAAVDFMIDVSGSAYVLEVNTMPGLKWFRSPTSGPVVDVAGKFLESILKMAPLDTPLLPARAPQFAH